MERTQHSVKPVMLLLNVIILAIQQGYDDLIILTSCRPMHKAECTVKILGLIVGITSLKAVMDVTGELFHLSKKSDKGNDRMFWHPSFFSVAIVWV